VATLTVALAAKTKRDPAGSSRGRGKKRGRGGKSKGKEPEKASPIKKVGGS